ncbi:MAG: ATP-binding protein [Dokdonella sp.]
MSIWIGWLVALIGAVALGLLWQWLRHEIAERIDLEREHAVLDVKMRELQAEHEQVMKIDHLAGLGQLMAGAAQQASQPIAMARERIDALAGQWIAHRNLATAYDEAVQTCLAPLDMLVGTDSADLASDDLATVLDHIETTRKRLFDARASLIASPFDQSGSKQLGDVDERLGRVEMLLKGVGSGPRPGDAGTEQVDVNQALDGALLIASRQLGERIRVIRRYAELPVVAGSVAQIHQMVLHLVVNASEAMAGDGVLTLETRRTDIGNIEIDIADSGVGISDEILPRVFEPFFTSRPSHQTGLGLTVVHRIVKAHQGSIQLRTQPGSGTRFTISLPIKRPAASNVTPLFRQRDRA